MAPVAYAPAGGTPFGKRRSPRPPPANSLIFAVSVPICVTCHGGARRPKTDLWLTCLPYFRILALDKLLDRYAQPRDFSVALADFLKIGLDPFQHSCFEILLSTKLAFLARYIVHDEKVVIVPIDVLCRLGQQSAVTAK